MLWVLLAWSLSLASTAAVALAMRAFVRGRRAASGPRPPGRAVAVVVSDPGVPVGSDLLRGLGTSVLDLEAPLATRVVTVPGDTRTREAIEETRRAVPGVDVAGAEASPPARHVASAWLGMAALADGSMPLAIAVDPSARPTSRQLAPVVRALGSAGLAAGCPAPVPGLRSFRSALVARAAGDLAPILFAASGPSGAFPLAVAARDGVVRAAADDPLSVNRASLASALCAAAPRADAVLVPRPIGVSDRPGAPARLLASHLAVLARARPGPFAAVAGFLAALPLGIAAWVAHPGGGTGTALLLTAAGRVLLAATWSRSVAGPAAALSGLLLSPARDLALLGLAGAAAWRGRVRRGTAAFLVHRGGVLSAAARRGGEED
jgi:hypothetical protein